MHCTAHDSLAKIVHSMSLPVCISLMPTPGVECSSVVLVIVFQFGLQAQDWAACLHAWSPYELLGWLLGDCNTCDLLLQGRRGACSAPRPERVPDRPRVFAQHGAPGALRGRSPHHNREGRPPFPTTQAFSPVAIQTPSEVAACPTTLGQGITCWLCCPVGSICLAGSGLQQPMCAHMVTCTSSCLGWNRQMYHH